MSALLDTALSEFALDVQEGLLRNAQKQLSPRYFYDELGSSLFEAITVLPEYGLTRADERLLASHADAIAAAVQQASIVAELGSGSGRKTKHVLSALQRRQGGVVYQPIDVSAAALHSCEVELQSLATVKAVCADWLQGLEEITASHTSSANPMLLLFLGSSIGNLHRSELPSFLNEIRSRLRTGDYFLLGVDLVKDVHMMIEAYDDPTGVTAAFNLNLLGRMNRELQATFDLREFHHEVRWNEEERRIEMHLRSCKDQVVGIGALKQSIRFRAGETIWTESSHKFTELELSDLAKHCHFAPVATWIDPEWPFAEILWKAF